MNVCSMLLIGANGTLVENQDQHERNDIEAIVIPLPKELFNPMIPRLSCQDVGQNLDQLLAIFNSGFIAIEFGVRWQIRLRKNLLA